LNTITVISQIVLCILSVAVVVAVLLQKPNDPNMSAAFGQGGGSYSKSVKSRSAEGKLNTITKIASVVMLTISLGLVILQRFAK
jgi:protein translocase SecG subunit